MKSVLPFFTLLALCSCGPTTQQKTVPARPEASAAGVEQHPAKPATPVSGKDDRLLRERFLKELYLRKAARISGDSLLVDLPFNLHGPDCGAPDCYSTDVRFGFAFNGTFAFPKSVPFREHEHGCVDSEKKLSGTFQLVETTEQHVIYYSARPKRTLVLFRSNAETGTAAWYFTGLSRNRITGKNLYGIVNDYNDEDPQAIYPFTSHLLTTNG